MARAKTSNGAKPRRITKRKAVEDHARSYFDALAARDAEGMLEHWHEDGVVDLVPLGVSRGREEIGGFFTELFAALPDLETTVTRLVAGEREAAGRPVHMRGIDLIEIEDGKNVSNTAYYDGMAFARQIGLMPAQDSGAERAMMGAFNAATRVRRAVADRMAAR